MLAFAIGRAKVTVRKRHPAHPYDGDATLWSRNKFMKYLFIFLLNDFIAAIKINAAYKLVHEIKM